MKSVVSKSLSTLSVVIKIPFFYLDEVYISKCKFYVSGKTQLSYGELEAPNGKKSLIDIDIPKQFYELKSR